MSAGRDETLPPTQTGRAGVPASAPIPERLGRFEIVRELARGGMGVVYVGRDPRLDREVAIKQCLPPRGSATQHEEQQRFLREARAVAQLQHPHIVSIFDVSEDGDASYFVMELIHGESLQDRLRREGPLPEREVARLGVQLAQAVEYAHGRGILHRDLKPHNVLLSEDGEPHVTDFGLAKVADLRDLETQADDPGLRAALPSLSGEESLTLTGQLLGTPSYMSPEQAEGQAMDARGDVYGLGATLYALLTGRPPHQGPSLINTLTSVLHAEAPAPSALRPDLDRGLERIVLRCLAREPDARYATCRELAGALAAWLKPSREPVASKGLAPLLAGLAVAAAAIAIGVVARGDRSASDPSDVASAAPLPSPPTTGTPAPSKTPAPRPAPTKTTAPQPAPTKVAGLRLQQSFVWKAPLRHPWRKSPVGGSRQYALIERDPDRFVRFHRGGGFRRSPVWEIPDQPADAVVLQWNREPFRVALASNDYVLRNVPGVRGVGELLEVDSGAVRLKRVERRGKAAIAAMSEDWIVQAFQGPRGWELAARSTSPDPHHATVLRGFPKVSSIAEIFAGEHIVGLHDASAGRLLVYRMPSRERMSDVASDPELQPDVLEPKRLAPLELGSREPIALSKHDLLALRLEKRGGIEWVQLGRDRRTSTRIAGTTCARGPRAAQYSPDGKRFAWIDAGTVHVVTLAHPTRRVSAPPWSGWVAFFWHADTSITVLSPDGVRRFEVLG